MIRCTRTRLLATGLVLAVVAAGIGWAFFFREKQKADALALQVGSMDPELAEFREWKEAAKFERAITDMKTIERAYKVFYLEHAEWPKQIEQVKKYIDPGVASVIDPWGKTYTVELAEVHGAAREKFLRPVASTQPPNGRPRIRVPEK